MQKNDEMKSEKFELELIFVKMKNILKIYIIFKFKTYEIMLIFYFKGK